MPAFTAESVTTGAAGLAILLVACAAQAAAPPPSRQQPAEEQLELPEFEAPQPAPLQLPPVPAPGPDATLSAGVRVHVSEFRFEGNTVFSDPQLSAIAAPYTGHEISSTELQELRYRLTLHYVEHGYINSGAIIPDQQVTDGIITLRIIEGTLNEIDISGQTRLRPSWLTERIALGAGPPLNVSTLGERLQILQQQDLIDRINATLAPGARPGESRLNVMLQEADPRDIWLQLDNGQSPVVGGESVTLGGIHRNLSGRGDSLQLELTGAEGLRELQAGYSLPVSARDTTLGVSVHTTDSEIVEPPFDVLDIESEERTLSLSLQQPFHRSVNETVSFGLLLDIRRSRSFLAGDTFPFVTGTDDGEARLTVVRLTQEWLKRSSRQVIAARSLISKGVDALNATVNGQPGDADFLSWLGQLQWARRVTERDIQLVLRADAQAANGVLPSMEQFTVGGMHTVRGYRENRIVADTGVVASVEVRIPVHTGDAGKLQWLLTPFFDYGRVANRSGDAPTQDEIASVGIGLLGRVSDRLRLDIYYGYALQDFDDEDDDIQDDGLNLRLRYSFL